MIRAHPPTSPSKAGLAIPSALVGLSLWGAITLVSLPAWAADLSRYSGRLQDLDPAGGTLSLEEVGPDGAIATRWVRFRGASVVRLTRRQDRPWEWRDSPTQIQRWPVGTFMTAVGTRTTTGAIEAQRIEIPAIE